MIRVAQEPVVALVVGLVTAACALLVAFGVDLTQEQIGALSAFAVAAFGLAVFVRSKVSPVKKSRPVGRGPVTRESHHW